MVISYERQQTMCPHLRGDNFPSLNGLPNDGRSAVPLPKGRIMLLKTVALLIVLASFASARHRQASSNDTARTEAVLAGTAHSSADGIRLRLFNHVPPELASSSAARADAWIIVTNTTQKGMNVAYQYDESVDLDVTTESGSPMKVKSGRHGAAEVRTRTYMSPGERQYIPIRLKDWIDVTEPATYYVKAYLRVLIWDSANTFTHRYVFVTDRVPVHFQ